MQGKAVKASEMGGHVSIIIPVLNEAYFLQKVVLLLSKVLPDSEIIIVDLGSRDGTLEIAKALAESKNAKVVIHPQPLSLGDVIIDTAKLAKGDTIVLLDADGTYDPLEIVRLIEPIKAGTTDLVIGSRFEGKIMPGAKPSVLRKLGNFLVYFLLRFMFGINVRDSSSGLRAFRKEFIDKLAPSKKIDFNYQVLVQATRTGRSIKEVPITFYPRIGRAKLIRFMDGMRIFFHLLRYRFRGFLTSGD